MRARTVKSCTREIVTLCTGGSKELMVSMERLESSWFPRKTIVAWFTKAQAKRLRAALDAYLEGA